MSNHRFEIRFDPDAQKEYLQLDHSVVKIVDKFLERLEDRADEIGKPLSNTHSSRLAGCKEMKLREAGIRIIFRVTDTVVEVLRVVYILAIERRSDDYVFKIADKRYQDFKDDAITAIMSAKPKKE